MIRNKFDIENMLCGIALMSRNVHSIPHIEGVEISLSSGERLDGARLLAYLSPIGTESRIFILLLQSCQTLALA